MEQKLEKATELFKSFKRKECLDLLLEIEKEGNLNSTLKKKVMDYKISIMAWFKRYQELYDQFDQEIQVSSKKSDWENVLSNIVYKVGVTFLEGKKEEALKIVEEGEKIIQKHNLTTPSFIESQGELLFWKGNITVWLNEFNKAIEYFNEAIAFAEKHSLSDTKHHSLHRLGMTHGCIGNYDIGIPLIKQAAEYFAEKRDLAAAGSYHNLGVLYAEKGEYKKSRECFEIKATFVDQSPHDISAIGDSYWREGDIENGLKIMEEGLEKIKAVFGDQKENVLILFIQANLNSRTGNQDIAKDQYLKILEKFGEKTEQTLVGFSNVGLANIYFHKGELDIAVKYGKKALAYFGKFGFKYGMGWSHFILSKINYEKGEMEKAFHHLQTSLDLRLAMGNKQDIALSTRDLITYLIEQESMDDVNDYLSMLERLTTTTDSKIVKQNYLLSKALVLKTKGRPKYWVQAIDILEDIVSHPIVDYNTILVALVNLCELLLDEFSISGDEEVLSDLKTHTDRLLDIAQRQNSYTLRVEAYHIRIITLWLLAQHSRVDINISNARRLLREACELAESHGLTKLAAKITDQNDKMLEKLESWDEFIRKYYDFIKSS
ncbi:MAG: tetratricopeptide repeat protein [Asgard group archaeon]|nr:tetratricopeptide repeat protein [Asgard group archaeon]